VLTLPRAASRPPPLYRLAPQTPLVPKGGVLGEFVLEDVHNVTLWDLVGDLVMAARVVAHNGYLGDLTSSRCACLSTASCVAPATPAVI
jgi:hypothetical protein